MAIAVGFCCMHRSKKGCAVDPTTMTRTRRRPGLSCGNAEMLRERRARDALESGVSLPRQIVILCYNELDVYIYYFGLYCNVIILLSCLTLALIIVVIIVVMVCLSK